MKINKKYFGVFTMLLILILGLYSNEYNIKSKNNNYHYVLSEDKLSAVVYIDVDNFIGEGNLISISDENKNTITNCSDIVTENKSYTYSVSYKEGTEIKNKDIVVVVEGILKDSSDMNQDKNEKSHDLYSLQQTPTEDKYFEISSNGNITKFNADVTPAITHVVIPSTINGITVKKIGYESFYGNQSIQSVYIPEGVDEIVGGSFENCSKLNRVILPNSVKSIGARAFKNCKLLKINFPDNLTTIGYESFYNCQNLDATLVIPDSVKNLYTGAFQYCTSLENVTLSNNITSLNLRIFKGCKFKSLKLPNGLKTIPADAFINHTNIESIEIPEGVERIEDDAFNSCTALKNISIPSTVTFLGERIFADCDSLEGIITIPQGITEIPTRMFYGCKKLNEVNLPDSVTSIGNQAFTSCLVAKFKLPETLKTIGEKSFSFCYNLDTLSIPQVTSIGESAFEYCTSLEEIILPDSLSTINKLIFRSCSNVKRLKLPNNINTIAEGSFSGLSITELQIPDSVTRIEGAFTNCEKLVTLNLPDGLQYIGESAFHGCKGLIRVVIPDTVTEMGEHVFHSCESLVDFKLSKNMDTIPRYTFYACRSLKNITIPSHVKHIQDYAFSSSSIETIKLPSQLQTIGKSAFEACTKLESISIPSSVTSISGNQTFWLCTNLKSANIQANISSIPDFMFYECSKLTDVSLSQTITTIGASSFAKTSLETITIPKNVTTINSVAFWGCYLTDVIFEQPSTITNIGANAFSSQKTPIYMYQTTHDGDYIDFKQYGFKEVDKIKIDGNNFTDLGNGIWKRNLNTRNSINEDPVHITYTYQLLNGISNSELTGTVDTTNVNAYKLEFVCDGNTLEEKYILQNMKIDYPSIPFKSGYTGIWNPDDEIVSQDQVCHALYKALPTLKNNRLEILAGTVFDPHDYFIILDADGNTVQNVSFKGNVNMQKTGEYMLTYNATDQWGGKITGKCYVVVKPNVIFPDYAELTYGQSLSEAKLFGNYTQGIYEFLENDQILTYKESGSRHKIRYISNDLTNKFILEFEIPVHVKQALPKFPSDIYVKYKQLLILNDIKLPQGWTWKDGHQKVKVGCNEYFAQYHDSEGNYKSLFNVRMIVTMEKKDGEIIINVESKNPQNLGQTGDSTQLSSYICLIGISLLGMMIRSKKMRKK